MRSPLVIPLGLALLVAPVAAQDAVRKPAVAGSFYPDKAEALRAAIDASLVAARPPAAERPIALVAPSFALGAGMGFSGLALLLATQHGVPRSDLGLATSFNQFSRSIGAAIGVALMGAVLALLMGRSADSLQAEMAGQGLRLDPDSAERLVSSLQVVFGLASGASMLAMLDYCDAVESGEPLSPRAGGRRVLGVDIDIRAHNRAAIEGHPLAHKIEMIQGSSIAPDVVAEVRRRAAGYRRVLVCLDSNHTHDHVLAELEAYAPLVSVGSYCCVFDTLIEDMPADLFPDRPWGKGCNPKTAVWEYLQCLGVAGRQAADGAPLKLEIDHSVEDKLLITVAPDGYLKRV